MAFFFSFCHFRFAHRIRIRNYATRNFEFQYIFANDGDTISKQSNQLTFFFRTLMNETIGRVLM